MARAYVTALRDLLRALGVSDVRMDQGSMRCDVNLSLSPRGSGVLGTRTETKNVNSLRSVERAVPLRDDAGRPACSLAAARVVQETRHFEEATGDHPRRAGRKETAEDYRYFPEPDLVPIAPPAEWVEELRATLPELPWQRRRRIQAEWALTDAGAARPGQRGRARPDRGHRRRRRPAGGGPVLVGVLPRPAGQRPRRRARRAADHPGPGGAGDRAGARPAS